MALPATLQWDVRTTGNDANGGAFDPGVTSPGTDFSQQSSAQIAYTDLVIGGTTTNLTSAANPFTSAHVGNTINITSGTGFTVGRYNVRSVASGVATMDRAVGTAASTGGVGNLGGSMATPSGALAAIVSNNTVWLKAGTYTITVGIAPTSGANLALIGYSAAHGDNLPGAIITTATNSVNLITVSGSPTQIWLHNLAMSHTATTRGIGYNNNSTTVNLVVSNCTMTGFSNHIAAAGHAFPGIHVINSWLSNSIGVGISNQSATSIVIQDSVISGSGGFGLQLTVSTFALINRSLIVGGSSTGILVQGVPGNLLEIYDSTIANNTGNGVDIGFGTAFFGPPVGFIAQNNIVYGNSLFGITAGTAPVPSVAHLFVRNNAYGANTSGNRNNIPAGVGDVILTVSPFTNSGAGDYSLNSAAGGGAALRGVGFPGVFPNGTTTGFPDIGAVQSSAVAPASAGYSATFLS
jgi:hypothetical protein